MAAVAVSHGVNNIATQSHQRPVFALQVQGNRGDSETTLNLGFVSLVIVTRLTRFELVIIPARIMAVNAVTTPAVFRNLVCVMSEPPHHEVSRSIGAAYELFVPFQRSPRKVVRSPCSSELLSG